MWFWTLLLAVASAAEPELTGRYSLAEPPAALVTKHEEAVEQALKQLPWAFRPFARSRLAQAVRNCAVVELRLDPTTFRSRCDDDGPVTHARGADSALTGDDGKRYTVALTTTAESATISFTGDEGGQRTIYAPQPDGALLLTKELFSPHLPKPVRWTVRYRRTSDGW